MNPVLTVEGAAVADGGSDDRPPRPFIGTYVLVDKKPVPEPDMKKWGEWMQTSNRRVGWYKNGCLEVSTIFLGLDMGFPIETYPDVPDGYRPRIFETAMFRESPRKRPPYTLFHRRSYTLDYMPRYRTWEAAEHRHRILVRMINRCASHQLHFDVLDDLWGVNFGDD